MDKNKDMAKKMPPAGRETDKAPYDPLKEDDGLAWARRVAEAEDAGLD